MDKQTARLGSQESKPKTTSKKFYVQRCSFEEVYPIWSKLLWPDRVSEIHAASTITFGGGYDANLIDSEVTFFAAVDGEGKIIGVISGHKTSTTDYRVRGVYVAERWRISGVGARLVQAIELQARVEQAKVIWTLPRETAFGFYHACGFEQKSDWIDKEYEFGPNCFASKEL